MGCFLCFCVSGGGGQGLCVIYFFNHKQPDKNPPDFSVLSFQIAEYVPYIPRKSKLLNFMYFKV